MPTDETRTLKLIVCVRYTLDVEEIGVDSLTGRPKLERATYRINDFDENGIEAVLHLRDRHEGRALGVSVLSEKPPDNVLLQALAMGIDELHLVCDSRLRDADALATASILGALIRKLEGADLVVCSDTSVDEHRGEIGPRLAEVLGIPSITYATRLTLDGNRLQADRALENWLETVDVPLPVLVTVGSETNQPRMPTLRQIRQADQRPIVEWRLTDLLPPEAYSECASRIETLTTYAPPSTRKRIVVDGETPQEAARSLVRHLLEDGVIKF